MKKNKIIFLLALVSLLFSACRKPTPPSESSEEPTTSQTTSTTTSEGPTTSDPTSDTTSEVPTSDDPSSEDPSSEGPISEDPSSEDPVMGYKITWLNWNGDTLLTHYNYPAGEMPVYHGDTPTRPEDDENTYEWDGWTPDLVPVVANATYTAKYIAHPKYSYVEPSDFVWGENSEGMILVGYYGSAPIIEIPETIDDKPVVALQKWAFFNNKTLRQVSIPDTVINIDEDAFNSCINLETITIGSSVETIGFDAFSNCTSLTSITLPDSVKSIGPQAFSSCTNLTNLHIPDTVESVDGSILNGSSLEVVTIYNKCIYAGNSENPYVVLLSPDHKTFGTEHLTVHADTKIIADGAFFGSDPTGVTFGANVHTIGMNAFRYCDSLTEIELPSSLRHIGMSAFEGCEILATITFGNQVETIGSMAFYNCKPLTNIVLPESITSVGSYAFYSWPDNIVYNEYDSGRYLGSATNDYLVLVDTKSEYITTIEIHANTKVIAGGAFSSCTNLTGVTIPAGVTNIGDHPFYSCYALTSLSVESGNTKFHSPTNNKAIMETATDKLLFGLKDGYIPEGTKVLGSFCFAYLGLKDSAISIPDSVVEIEEYAFYNASAPTTFIIPNSVTKIGYGAFQYCKNVQTLTISNQIKKIEPWTFSGCSDLTSITIPDSVTIIDERAFDGCKKATTVTFGVNVRLIAEVAFSSCEMLATPQLNNNLRVIGGGAFGGCYLITAVEFGEHLIHLEGHSFDEAPIASITVHPDNPYFDSRMNCNAVISKKTDMLIMGCRNTTIDPTVVGIGPWAFTSVSITSITLPSNIVTIETGAFSYCGSLTSITIEGQITAIPDYCFNYCSNLENFTVPSSVTSIGIYAFADTKLATLEIPTSVTSIGRYCFSYCYNLSEIEIPSSVTSLANGVFNSCTALTKITLHEGLTSIGRYTFSYCEILPTIVIPSTVTTIEYRAFYRCDSLSIYALAASLPSGWNESWNPNNRPIYWYSEDPIYDGAHWHYVEGVPTVWVE